MRAFSLVWTDVGILVRDTGRLWWRLLPQVLSVYLLGWLGAELALKVAAAVGGFSAWLALAVFAFGFLSQLVAAIVILRMAGRELGIADLIPDEEREADERDSSLTHLLAVTLLPFLGIYAAFGQVQEAASRLATEQLLRSGIIDSSNTILGVLNQAATTHRLRLGLVLVLIYLVRRTLDTLHERTGRRALGLLVALVESFFILVVIMGGVRVWEQLKLWLEDRAILAWLATVEQQAGRVLAVFRINLPKLLVNAARFFSDQVWPVFWEVLSQPIIWLAVAALVYGTRVLSVAELWRAGRPVGSRLPGIARLARRPAPAGEAGDAVASRRLGPPPAGLQRALVEVREAFFGDIDDKYLPTFHSIRLVLRAGAPFLGALVLVYAVQTASKNYLDRLVDLLVGGHLVDFWVVTGPAFDLFPRLVVEPLRICLLAVAFRRCLELFKARSGPLELESFPSPAGSPVASP